MTRRRLATELWAPVIGCAVALIAVPVRADEAACIASSEQALSLRQQGKLHDALKQLALCADAACSSEVKAECTQRIGGIDAAMPTLVLAATDGAGNDLADVRVTMDGAPLASTLDGRPLSIDPGEHTFTVEALGRPSAERKLVLREGEKDRHESFVLGAAPPLAASPMPSAVPAPSPVAWSTRKTLAVGSGAVGVVGVGLGLWLGAFAASSQSKEKTDCSTAACNSRPQAIEDYNTAKEDALGSTIAFVAGAAMIATGAVLWFTAPAGDKPASSSHRLRVAPRVDATSGRFVVGGEF